MEQPRVTLAEYLAWLKAGEAVPLPPGGEEWADHVRRISAEGQVGEVPAEQYDYWLEVLPPRWMNGAHFCFAEGAEAFRLFWHDRTTGRHLARQLSWDETLRFCELAGIPRPY
ncbi:MAG TPA: hypothetical protein VEL76_35050 [Gemmataceae bacterium]|nr:hypothetical protein [Gemmataceae bacterium]